MEMIKCCIKYLTKKTISGFLHLFWIFPIQKKKILFMNDHSYNFSDNLKYLSLYLQNKNIGKYDIYFSLKNDDGIPDTGITPIKFLSLAHFYHALTSGVVITNNSGIVYLPIRKKQLVINTWHGGGPYKVTGTDDINNVWYAKDMEYNAKKVSYYLSSCQMCSDTEAKAMSYKANQIVNCGMPRMDCFFSGKMMNEARKKVFSTYGIPEGSQLVLYAPTFRGSFDNYDGVIDNDLLEIDYHRMVTNLKQKFGGEWVFAIRLHPRLKDIQFKKTDFINMSHYSDAQELLMAADALVTDYSSIMWDFSFSKKPIFLYAPDINDYEVKRGFFMPPEEWPYPIATTDDELECIIQSYDQGKYVRQLEKHYQEVGNNEKGIACETVKKMIDEHINKQ